MTKLSYKIRGKRKSHNKCSQPVFFKAYVVEEFLKRLGKIDRWGGYYAYAPKDNTYTLKGYVRFRTIKADEERKVLTRDFKGTAFRFTKLTDAVVTDRSEKEQPILFYPSLGDGALNLLQSDSRQDLKIIREEGPAQDSSLHRPKCSSGASNIGPRCKPMDSRFLPSTSGDAPVDLSCPPPQSVVSGASNVGPRCHPTDSRCIPSTSRDAPVDLSCPPLQSVVSGASNVWPRCHPTDSHYLPSTLRDAPVDLSCPPPRSDVSSDAQFKGVKQFTPRRSTPYSRPSLATLSGQPTNSSVLSRKTRLSSHSTLIVTPMPDRSNSPMPSLIPIEPNLSEGDFNGLASVSFQAEDLIPLPSLLDESLSPVDTSSPDQTTSSSASALADVPLSSAPESPPRPTAPSPSASVAPLAGASQHQPTASSSSVTVAPPVGTSQPQPSTSSSAAVAPLAGASQPQPTALLAAASVTPLAVALPRGPNTTPDPESLPGPSNPTPAPTSTPADAALQGTSDAPASSKNVTAGPASNAITGPAQKVSRQRKKQNTDLFASEKPLRRSARIVAAEAAKLAASARPMPAAHAPAGKAPSRKRKSRASFCQGSGHQSNVNSHVYRCIHCSRSPPRDSCDCCPNKARRL